MTKLMSVMSAEDAESAETACVKRIMETLRTFGGTMSEEQVLPEFVATLKAAAEKATPGPWHHVQAFQTVPKTRTIHGTVPAQRVDFVATKEGPPFDKIIAPMEGREQGMRSCDMAYVSAASPENILKLLASLAQSEAERDRLQEQLTTVLARESAATARHDAKLEKLETKLARERERNQELRQVVTNATYRMIALHGEGDYEECGEALWDCDCDLAKEYRDARALLAPHTEPQPAPVVTGEK